MSVNFYDVNFNQDVNLEQTNIPAISGYIIDDYAYQNLQTLDGIIPDEHIISKPSATNNLSGAISMNRKMINVDGTQVATCELRGYNHYIYVDYTSAGPINVTICDNSGNTVQTLTLPYLENNNNLSLVGHFDANDELDWCSVGYSFRDENRQNFVFVNVNGFSSSIVNELKPYVYLKYKYPYQVVEQTSLRGTDNFKLCQIPLNNLKVYGTGENQSRRFNDVVIRCDDEDAPTVYDVSASWWRDPPISTAPQWWRGYNVNQLALTFGVKYTDLIGSDMTRLMPDGKFYNGLDGNNANLAWTATNPSSFSNYDIAFTGGILRFTFVGGQRVVQLLDKDENVIDTYQLPYPTSGGASSIATGTFGSNLGRYGGIGNLYLAEENNKYYLIALRYQSAWYNDNDEQIILSNSSYGTYTIGIAYQIVYEFSNEGNTLLFHATEKDVIVPVNPEEITGDETSNQTSDNNDVNEFGNEIDKPNYTDGEWEDGSTDGIRGSGEGQPTGGNAEGSLDEQPDMPDKPNIPTAVSTGFMKLYAPTNAEIQALCAELTDDSALTALKKYFGNNPLDFIVGLHVVPGTFTKDSNKYSISYGSFESSVTMFPITDEFTTIDYGKVDLKEIYGNWEDYNPHTKMSIYLPYIGIKELDPDRVNGTVLNLKYHVDAVTGSILAVLTSVRKDNRNNGAEILVGQWCGQASYTIPLTNTQHDSAVNAVISLVGATAGIGLAVGTGGASALVTAGAVGSVGNALLSGAKSQKTDISLQGAVSGSLAFFTGSDAYVQIEFPVEGRPNEYNHIIGMPSNITTTIANQPLNNYIEFVNVDVSGIDAPSDEKSKIISLLKDGVYT